MQPRREHRALSRLSWWTTTPSKRCVGRSKSPSPVRLPHDIAISMTPNIPTEIWTHIIYFLCDHDVLDPANPLHLYRHYREEWGKRYRALTKQLRDLSLVCRYWREIVDTRYPYRQVEINGPNAMTNPDNIVVGGLGTAAWKNGVSLSTEVPNIRVVDIWGSTGGLSMEDCSALINDLARVPNLQSLSLHPTDKDLPTLLYASQLAPFLPNLVSLSISYATKITSSKPTFLISRPSTSLLPGPSIFQNGASRSFDISFMVHFWMILVYNIP